MSSRFAPAIVIVVMLLAIWFHVGLVAFWPIISIGFHLVVLTILGVALLWSWSWATWLALLAGIVLGQYSAWAPTYVIALVGMVVATRVIVQRWIATRSSASLVVTAMVATILYYLLAAGAQSLAHSLNLAPLGPQWSGIWPPMIVQSIVHPAVIYAVWRRFRGGSYARTSASPSF